MSDAIPSRPPLSPAEGWNPPSRDFFGGPPPVGMTDPANVPPVQSEHEFLHGEVPPEVVFTAGGAIAAPKQARRYASAADVMEVALEKLGTPPGAAHYAVHGLSGDVEKAEDRARAFEVIARAAVDLIDTQTADDEIAAWDALKEAVSENRAAINDG